MSLVHRSPLIQFLQRRVEYPLVKNFLIQFFRTAWPEIEVIGKDHLPKHKSTGFIVIADPHQSHWDSIILLHALSSGWFDLPVVIYASEHLWHLHERASLRSWWSPKELFHYVAKQISGRFIRHILNMAECSPLDRDDKIRAHNQKFLVIPALKNNRIVAGYPAGGRVRDEIIPLHRSGIYDVAIKTRVRVQPCILVGTIKTWNPHESVWSAWFKGIRARLAGKSPTIQVRFEKPFYVVENEAAMSNNPRAQADDGIPVFSKEEAKTHVRGLAEQHTGWPIKDISLESHGKLIPKKDD